MTLEMKNILYKYIEYVCCLRGLRDSSPALATFTFNPICRLRALYAQSLRRTCSTSVTISKSLKVSSPFSI